MSASHRSGHPLRLVVVVALCACLLVASAGRLASAEEAIPTDLSTLHLTLSLPGRPPAPNPAWQTALQVSLEMGDALVYSQTVTCDAVGAWQLTDLPSGTANLRVRGGNTLTNLRQGLVLIPGLNLAYLGMLRAGDLNGDEAIDIVDFSLFRGRYGTADALADLDNNGWVDIVDFSLLRTNFGLRGPVALTGEERP